MYRLDCDLHEAWVIHRYHPVKCVVICSHHLYSVNIMNRLFSHSSDLLPSNPDEKIGHFQPRLLTRANLMLSHLQPFLLCHSVKLPSVSIWTLLMLHVSACISSFSVAVIKHPDKNIFKKKGLVLEESNPSWHGRHGSRQRRYCSRSRSLPSYIPSALREERVSRRWGMLWSLQAYPKWPASSTGPRPLHISTTFSRSSISRTSCAHTRAYRGQT